MPKWTFHSKPLTAFRRRFRTNVDPTEILTGVIPTAQADKWWPSDQLNVFGVYGQAVAGVGNYLSVSLVAQQTQVLVWRIVFGHARNGFPTGAAVHLFTPLQGYQPWLNNTAIFLAWLQTGILFGEPAALGETFTLSGDNAAQQVVLVNGAPNISIGPVHQVSGQGGAGSAYNYQKTIWSAQDPPLRIAPFTSLCVQTTNVAFAGDALDVSFYYSEVEDVGRVG